MSKTEPITKKRKREDVSAEIAKREIQIKRLRSEIDDLENELNAIEADENHEYLQSLIKNNEIHKHVETSKFVLLIKDSLLGKHWLSLKDEEKTNIITEEETIRLPVRRESLNCEISDESGSVDIEYDDWQFDFYDPSRFGTSAGDMTWKEFLKSLLRETLLYDQRVKNYISSSSPETRDDNRDDHGYIRMSVLVLCICSEHAE